VIRGGQAWPSGDLRQMLRRGRYLPQAGKTSGLIRAAIAEPTLIPALTPFFRIATRPDTVVLRNLLFRHVASRGEQQGTSTPVWRMKWKIHQIIEKYDNLPFFVVTSRPGDLHGGYTLGKRGWTPGAKTVAVGLAERGGKTLA
jgi:hypothetical protein